MDSKFGDRELTVLQEPVRVALIGTGKRSTKIYKPLFKTLKPWIEIVAVCDPVKEHSDTMAEALGVRAYYDIKELVKDKLVEAAIVVTPPASHHSISVYLSSNGIHNLIETPWCNTLAQARQMIDEAKKNDVLTRVGENFFRFPVDRFAQVVRNSGYIGKIKRIFTYNDHTGYHNNSRWITFAQSYPLWVQSLYHTMGTIEFNTTPERHAASETFRSHMFMFPDNLLVVDQASNIKGLLGRQVRPGHTEWHGEWGALSQQGYRSTNKDARYYEGNGMIEELQGRHSNWTAELRVCNEKNVPYNEGSPDIISEVIRKYENGRWASIHAYTPSGKLEYVNHLRPEELSDNYYPEYGTAVMGHIVDFALAIRNIIPSEFDEQDAMMSLMMQVGAQESALQGGAKIAFPLTSEAEAERNLAKRLQEQFGVDHLDVEGMLAISYPKP